MLKVRTFNTDNLEYGLVECEAIEFHDRASLICIDVQTIDGAIDVTDYIHNDNNTHIVIPSCDLSQVIAA